MRHLAISLETHITVSMNRSKVAGALHTSKGIVLNRNNPLSVMNTYWVCPQGLLQPANIQITDQGSKTSRTPKDVPRIRLSLDKDRRPRW